MHQVETAGHLVFALVLWQLVMIAVFAVLSLLKCGAIYKPCFFSMFNRRPLWPLRQQLHIPQPRWRFQGILQIGRPVDVFPPIQTFKLLLCVYLFLTPVRNTVQWIEAMVGMIHQSHHKSNGMFMLTWHSIVKLVVHNSKVDNKCRCSEVWVKVSHCLWQGTHFLGEQTRVCVGNTGEHNTVSVCINQIPFHELSLNA